MATIKQLLSSAHSDLSAVTSLLLDRCVPEINDILNCLSELGERADENSTSSLPCGLFATGYFLAGVVSNISYLSARIIEFINKVPRTNKLLKYQELLSLIANALIKECHDPLLHVSSQIGVLMDHPAVDYDMHTRLTLY